MAGSDTNAWLGGRQGGKTLDQNWHWLGDRWGYTSWAAGEPNDTPFGDYIPGSEQHLETLLGDGSWNDAPGFEEKYFIVELEHCS